MKLWVFTLTAVFFASACERQVPHWLTDTGGQTPEERGRILVASYGCSACHEIAGVAAYPGHIGPSLTNWPQRKYIAGRLVNSKESLTAWLMQPQHINPGTAMPDLGITEKEARDMVAWLFSQ